jgi:hypothetical protein
VFTEHAVQTLVMQRIVGIALGHEDLNDHDELRHDPVMAVLANKLAASRADCAPLAGKSTLNRLERSKAEPTRYNKIAAGTQAIERLFVDLFLDGHAKAPSQIIWTSMPPMIRCMAIKKASSSTVITIATAICPCMSSAAVTCWRRSCAAPTSTPPPGRWRR